MKTNDILAAYEAELKRTLGPNISVTMDKRRVLVTTRPDSPGNRYTIAEIQEATKNLKKRPNVNSSLPDFLIIP